MNIRTMFFLLALTINSTVSGQDSDGDGIPDVTENWLLSTFAPVWRPDLVQADFEGTAPPFLDRYPPLPIRWYVEHCDLQIWHNDLDFDYAGATNRGILLTNISIPNLEFALSLIQSRLPSLYFYRLNFRSFNHTRGLDPNNARDWQAANVQQDCVYGRCTHLDNRPQNEYLLQYFVFFGYNDVGDYRNDIGCPIGNHMGDVGCVEFEVRWSGFGNASIIRAVYDDHGRQVFIDNPNTLDYLYGHPVVYLEGETHEALPWAGACGFDPGHIAACIGVNSIFRSEDVFTVPVGGECDDVPVVRTHWGQGGDVLVASVINIGERDHPGSNLEAQFIHAFPGLYGAYATDCCDDPSGHQNCRNINSPMGPTFQDKMWDRAWKANGNPVLIVRNYRVPEFPGCPDGTPWQRPARADAHVELGYSGKLITGTFLYPFTSLQAAIDEVSVDGIINIKPGHSPEAITPQSLAWWTKMPLQVK
jgi:hypothetical protein